MISPKKTGLALGTLLAIWHIFWAVLVLTGLAQTIIDFVFWMHFLNNPFVVTAFTFAQLIALVFVAALVGFVLGWIYAVIWNRLHGKG